MKPSRFLGAATCLVWFSTWTSGCQDTPTSPVAVPTDSAAAGKSGPDISFSITGQASYPLHFTLDGTVGKTGSIALWTKVTLDGIDRSSDFVLPTSKTVQAPYNLGTTTIDATSTARPGDYVLTLTATDSSGNTSHASKTFSLHLKPLELRTNPTPYVSVWPGQSFSLDATPHYREESATISYQLVPQEPSISLPTLAQAPNGQTASATVTVGASAPLGNYRLIATLSRPGGATDTASVAFSVIEKTTRLVGSGSLDLGNQKDSNGSYLDVANATAWTSGMGKPYSTIDVVFQTDSSGRSVFLSPAEAAIEGLGQSISWPIKNSTVIVDAGPSVLNSAEAIKASIGTSASQKAIVIGGHYYALRLSTGEYAALKATSLTSSGSTAISRTTVRVEIYNTTLFDRGDSSTQGDVQLGTQVDANPSFLDVADITSILSSSKKYGSIDVVSFNDANGRPSFLSPFEAATESLGGLSGWPTRNSTIIVDAGTADLSTAESVKVAIGSSTSQKAAVVFGHAYAVKLSTGRYATLKATSVSSSGNAVTVHVTYLP